MAQPLGMRSSEFPDHVYHLKKVIYGLWKAPGACYLDLPAFLVSLGFVTSRVDTSLFVYYQDSALIYFLYCFHDLIIRGSDATLMDTIMPKLDVKFATKDLGALFFFCGVTVRANNTGVFFLSAEVCY